MLNRVEGIELYYTLSLGRMKGGERRGEYRVQRLKNRRNNLLLDQLGNAGLWDRFGRWLTRGESGGGGGGGA